MYYRPFELINSLPVERITVITNNKHQLLALTRYIKISKKEINIIKAEKGLNMEWVSDTLNSIQASGSNYSFIDTAILDSEISFNGQLTPVWSVLENLGAQRIYNSLNRSELWLIKNRTIEPAQAQRIATKIKTVNSRLIGLLGTPSEVNAATTSEYKRFTSIVRKVPYSLPITNRTPKQNHYYINRNHINLLITPTHHPNENLGAKVRSFTSTLERNGWSELSLDDESGFKIWRR
ncbi:hypothetical protein NBRC116583_24010 [Arenicella sp. 4NH20-0111]